MQITAIKQQAKRPDRYSVFVEGKFAFGLSESGLLSSGLVSGQEIDNHQLTQLKKAAGLDKAYGNALRYVALRPRSEGELADYFRRKQIDAEAAQHITDKLRRTGLLDDTAFARAWVANRRQLKSVSTRRLRVELKQKRVAEEIIEQVLNEDEVDEMQILRDIVAKKQARYPDKQKLVAYLARQGFGYDDIKTVLDEQ